MSPPRCPHCGAVADPVGEMIAAMKAGKVAELSPKQIAAFVDAAEAPGQAERIRPARAEVLTPAQTVARAEMDRRAAAQTAFIATFAGMTPAAVADRFVNLSDAKVTRMHDVAMNMTGPGAAELERGAFEALDRRGYIIRRAA